MSDCSYPSCMMGGQGCDRESICDATENELDKRLAKTYLAGLDVGKAIQQKELTQLRDALREISTNLNVCKNDYWLMKNLLEKYSTDKQQAINDCVERMKFRGPIFNTLLKYKELIDGLNKGEEK